MGDGGQWFKGGKESDSSANNVCIVRRTNKLEVGSERAFQLVRQGLAF